jgi:hypothetical protein
MYTSSKQVAGPGRTHPERLRKLRRSSPLDRTCPTRDGSDRQHGRVPVHAGPSGPVATSTVHRCWRGGRGSPSIASLSHDGRSIASLSHERSCAVSIGSAASKSRWSLSVARPAQSRRRLDQQHHLGSKERDAVPAAGDAGKRASEDVAAFLIDPDGPDRAGRDHLSGQREVLAAQDQRSPTRRPGPVTGGLGPRAGPAVSRRPAGQGPGGWPPAMT